MTDQSLPLTTITVRGQTFDVTVDKHGVFRTNALGKELASLTLSNLTPQIIRLQKRDVQRKKRPKQTTSHHREETA